jgi:hypothetical protein
MADDKVKLIAEFKDRMSGPMKTAGYNSEKFSKSIKKVGVGAIAVGVAILALAKKMGDLAAKVRNTAADLHVGTDEVQAFNYAFEQTGGSVETFKSAMRGVTTFMRMAETGAAEQTRVLESLGTSYGIGAMTDTTTQATTAATLFGARYSQQIIGTLEQVGGSLRQVTQDFKDSDMLIPAEDITRLGEFADKWTDIEKKMQSMMVEAIIPMLPMIEGMADKFIDLATDAIPQLIEAAEKSIPVLIGMADAAIMAVDGWNKLLSTEAAENIDENTAALDNMAAGFQAMVDAGLLPADEALKQFIIESNRYTEAATSNVADMYLLRQETQGVALDFDFARRALSGLLGMMDMGQIMSDLGSSFASTGEYIVNMLVDVDLLKTTLATLSAPPIVPDGDLEEELTKAEMRWEYLHGIKMDSVGDIAEAEAAAAARRQTAELVAIEVRKAASIEARAALRLIETEDEAARVAKNQEIVSIGMVGARSIAQEMISGVDGWEERALMALAKMAAAAAAIQIGGPIGGIIGFAASLFQQGTPSIPRAQSGWQTPSSLYGDRFLVGVEGGEEIISREQRIMNNNYNTSSSSVNLNIAYQPLYSSASPAEVVRFGSMIVKALDKRGVSLV